MKVVLFGRVRGIILGLLKLVFNSVVMEKRKSMVVNIGMVGDSWIVR